MASTSTHYCPLIGILYLNIISMITLVTSSKLIDRTLVVANQQFYNRCTVVIWRDDPLDFDHRYERKLRESLNVGKIDREAKATSNEVHKITAKSPDYLGEFLQQYMGLAVVLTNKESSNIDLRKYTQVTVFADSSREATEILKMLGHAGMTPFQVLLVITVPIRMNSLKEITKAAWNSDVGDILVITQDDIAGGDIVKTWTFFPFTNNECGNTNPIERDINEAIFPSKFANFHQCPIKVTLLPIEPYLLVNKENGTVTSVGGLDGELLKLILDKTNSSMQVVRSDDHGGFGTFKNGTGTGSFGDLVDGIADMMIPALVMTLPRYSEAQISVVYETVDAVWYGPNQREVYAWAKVFLPFYSIFTVYLMLSFTVFIAATRLVRKYALCKPETQKSVFMQTFVLFLGQEVRFETKCWLVNSMFVMWLWFCMVMRIAYQGQLVDGLQKVILEPPLGTFDEAIKTLDGFGGEEVFRDYTQESAAKNYKVLAVDELGPYVRAIAEGRRFLIVTDILVLQMYKVQVQVLDEAVFRTPVCIHMRPGWPASNEVRLVISRLVETGLVERVTRDFEHEIRRRSTGVANTTPLSLGQVGALFLGLLAMFLVCFIIFCGEIVWFTHDLRKRLRKPKAI